MPGAASEPSVTTPPGGFTPSFIRGLCLLLDAWECARAEHLDVWRLALEIRRLREAGLTHTRLRWLLNRGYAQQALEMTKPDDPRRSFRPVGNLSLAEEACFVLTDAGAALARAACPARGKRPWRGGTPGRPAWDQAQRTLWWGSRAAKRFKRRAPLQELLLQAFEEQGWASRIDDPVPPEPGVDPKRRLAKTIEHLNQGLRFLHFEGGGDGESICWRPATRKRDKEGMSRFRKAAR